MGCESANDVWQKQFRKAFDYVVETCDLIRMGKVPSDQLVISKILRKPVDTYRSLFPHVVAAIQMVHKGYHLKRKEKIDFVYVNAEHKNPFKRIVPAAILGSTHHPYDPDKYVQLVLDVAETVLGVFGFNRKQLGFRSRPKDYIEEVRVERSREILSRFFMAMLIL